MGGSGVRRGGGGERPDCVGPHSDGEPMESSGGLL